QPGLPRAAWHHHGYRAVPPDFGTSHRRLCEGRRAERVEPVYRSVEQPARARGAPRDAGWLPRTDGAGRNADRLHAGCQRDATAGERGDLRGDDDAAADFLDRLHPRDDDPAIARRQRRKQWQTTFTLAPTAPCPLRSRPDQKVIWRVRSMPPTNWHRSAASA